MSYARLLWSCVLVAVALVAGFAPMAEGGSPPHEPATLTTRVGAQLAHAFGSLDEAAAALVVHEAVDAQPATADEVFAAGDPAVRHCRKRVARDFGPQRGRLRLAVTTDATGVVSSVAVRENEATDKLVECIRSVIETWHFPATGRDEIHERLWLLD